MGFEEFYRARAVFEEILERDLMGPVEDDETVQGLPTSYYTMGKLYPMRNGGDSQDGPVLLEASEEPMDAPISLSNQYEPSSMGFTFAVSGNPRLTINVSYARYDQLESAPGAPKEKGEESLRFKRHPFSAKFTVGLTEGTRRVEADGGAHVYVSTRRPSPSGARAVTVSLVNCDVAAGSRAKVAAQTLFQPRIEVRLEGQGSFFDIDWRRRLSKDPELAELDLLYRHSGCFAQGHGCSVAWEDSAAPSWVATEVMPRSIVRQTMPRPSGGLAVFKMRFLSEAPRQEVVSQLGDFVDEYDAWIVGTESASEGLEQIYEDAARRNLSRCREAERRLRDAVRLLERDDLCFRAFRLANKAMLLQWERSAAKRGELFDADRVSWYPFQLAFILQELRSFVDPSCAERALADLLWFPTGGGKTEAYLGIAAFCIFLRRLRDPLAGGVTVIMRYTLRLLTIQQFERASTMIAACEQVRRGERIGGPAISIGLWVGGSLTPNRLEEARESLEDLKSGVSLPAGKANPVQVTRCPWCGTSITAADYSVDLRSKRMLIRCPSETCAYHAGEGLPIHLVDDDLYENGPTFVVATVDKFAQVPKKGESSRLFGIGTGLPGTELIIQDELHLISGPLGTMVGLYESAIERLCAGAGVPPKVVASTATVRNASEQVRALYARDFAQFPPQGIDIRDSFFAVEAPPEERPSRLYLGTMGVGVTQTSSLIRVLASVLFATRYLEAAGFSDEVVDAYWTIVGYFCTLRELGGALTAVLDRVQQIFAFLADSKLAQRFPGVDPHEGHNRVLELTSRKNNSEIVESIRALEAHYSAEDRFDAYSFVLATNMISVGVDVARLGTMVVDSQPKSNSEYIQATSRVGRRNPGVVVVALNASRSRDRSHYEQFPRFHGALYRGVESSSVTPFSDRARDRGLHTAFVTLCRYLVDGLSGNEAASDFRCDLPGVDSVASYLLERVEEVDPRECEDAEREIREIAWEWEERARRGGLVYWDSRNEARSLLKRDLEDDRFRAMNSMRNVEPSSNVYIVG